MFNVMGKCKRKLYVIIGPHFEVNLTFCSDVVDVRVLAVMWHIPNPTSTPWVFPENEFPLLLVISL